MVPAMSTEPSCGPGSASSDTIPLTESADFGFRQVPVAEKKKLVRSVFDSVAGKYDLMNDLMSGGIHRLWKDELIRLLCPRPGEHLLDVAGGTGDIAFRFLAATEKRAGTKIDQARVTVCDINHAMLSVGRDRAIDHGILRGIDWICGDAEQLPVPSGSIDCYTIAFGLRNVTDIDRALSEARRVLRPGGRFLCLEFSKVTLPLLEKPYDFYSFEVLPRLGAWVAGDADSYRYLAESIRRFPPQQELVDRMARAGLERARYRNLTGGVAAIHIGWRV